MKKSVLSVLMVMVLALALLAGCGGSGEVTAESLLKDVQKNSNDAKSMDMQMIMDMTMTSEDLGGSMDMSLDMDMKTTMDPIACSMIGTMSMLGQSLDMEMYMIVDGDEVTTYVGLLGQWMKETADYDSSTDLIDTTAADLSACLDKLTLAEETEDVDGKEAYIITGTITGDVMEDILGSTEELLDSMTDSGMDMSQFSVDLKYAIGKDDKLPVYMDMTFNGMEGVVDDSDFSIDNCTIRLNYKGFDNVDAITVPQEAIDNASEA